MTNRSEFEKICTLDDIIDQEGGLGLDPFGNAQYDYRNEMILIYLNLMY